jgi:predicted nucleic acid-binding protein
VASEEEVLLLINNWSLAGTGIGYVDAQLLAAARISSQSRLWTADASLASAAERVSIGFKQF